MAISSANIHVIKTLTVNDTSKTISKCLLDRFLILVIVWCHVTFRLKVFHLWQTNFASYEGSTVSAYLFDIHPIHCTALYCVNSCLFPNMYWCVLTNRNKAKSRYRPIMSQHLHLPT